MKKVIVLSLILLGLISNAIIAQLPGKVNVGIGGGLDYGGLGGQLSFYPAPRIGLFGGLGYNLNSVGYNVGAQLNFPNDKRVNFHLAAMYGYNAVMRVEYAGTGTVTKTTYYGPSVAAGVIFKSRRTDKAYLNLELILPFRSQEYRDTIDNLKAQGSEVVALPIAFSIAYHFKL